MIKLASNENSLGPSPKALEAIKGEMSDLGGEIYQVRYIPNWVKQLVTLKDNDSNKAAAV